jgi:Pyridoxamine 5'-phosphate oxidase
VSVSVDLQALRNRVGDFGSRAFLVTVGDDGRPHVVSVHVDTDGELLVVAAGRRTSANVAARPAVTLLWPAPTSVGVMVDATDTGCDRTPDSADFVALDEYGLIVDGAGELVDSDPPAVAIRPTAAILHRLADTAGDGPSCVPVLPRP